MTLRTQNIIFVLFLVGFIIAAPLVVLQTSGYRYSSVRHRWEKAGVLQVDSTPSNALATITLGEPNDDGLLSLFSNGSTRILKRTPATINGLLPKTYNLEVWKEGFLPWRKDFTIVSGQTTFADRIVLFRDTHLSSLFTGDVLAMTIADDGTVAFATQNQDGMHIRTVRGDTSRESAILSTELIDSGTTPHLRFSNDNSTIIVSGTHAGLPTLITLPLISPVVPVENKGADCTQLEPFPSGSNAGCINKEQELSILTSTGITERTLPENTYQDIKPWQEGLLAIKRSGSRNELWYITRRNEEFLAPIPREMERLQNQEPDLIIVTDARGQTALAIPPDEPSQSALLPFPVRGITSEKNAPFILWNDNEVFTLDRESLTPTLITRIATPLVNAMSTAHGNAVIYVTDGAITAIETDSRERKNTTPLGTAPKIIAAQSYSTTLYLIIKNTTGTNSAIDLTSGLYVRELR